MSLKQKNEVIVKLDKIRMLCCVKMKPCKRQIFDNVNICLKKALFNNNACPCFF